MKLHQVVTKFSLTFSFFNFLLLVKNLVALRTSMSNLIPPYYNASAKSLCKYWLLWLIRINSDMKIRSLSGNSHYVIIRTYTWNSAHFFRVHKHCLAQSGTTGNPQRNNQLNATIDWFYYLAFIYSSTCFERPYAHHQELKNCSSSLSFYRWNLVVAVLLVVVGPAGPTTTNSTAITKLRR